MKKIISIFFICFLLMTLSAITRAATIVQFDTAVVNVPHPKEDLLYIIKITITNAPAAAFTIQFNFDAAGSTAKINDDFTIINNVISIDPSQFSAASITENLQLIIKGGTYNLSNRFIILNEVISDNTVIHNHPPLIFISSNIDLPSFQANVGSNFDFAGGIDANNLSASVDFFVPDLLGKRFGIDCGVYENKIVTISSSEHYDFPYRSNFPDSMMHYSLIREIGSVAKSTEIRNLGAYASLLFRLGDTKNPNFRVYLEFTFDLIKRSYSDKFTYNKDTSVSRVDTTLTESYQTDLQLKKQTSSGSFTEEYFSIGLLTHYIGGNFEYCGEVLAGLFSSPFEKNYKNHWFYNATFELSYKNWISLGGEIRHNYFFAEKDIYYVVTLSKIVPIEAVVEAGKKLLGVN